MPSLLQRYATPFTLGLFLVSLISGIALFLHVAQGTFREMHEWLSLLLVGPFILHVWKNWRPMLGYMRKPALPIALATSVAAALPFGLQQSAGEAGGPPQFALARTLLGNTGTELAPLLHTTPANLVKALESAGFTVASADQPLTDVAIKSGKSEFELAGALNSISQ